MRPQTASAGDTIYVDQNASGTNNGTSWTNAYTDLQTGLTNADSGDEILVATGVYTPGASASATFALKAGVEMYGGYPTGGIGERDWEPNPTVLSGDLSGDDTTDSSGVVTDTNNINGANAYHVVSVSSGITSSTVLNGFYITAGDAIGTTPDDNGGGIYSSGGSPVLKALHIEGNHAAKKGAAIVAFGGTVDLEVGYVERNFAGESGGGIYLTGSAVITDSYFTQNSAATSVGGGIIIDSSLPASIKDTRFEG